MRASGTFHNLMWDRSLPAGCESFLTHKLLDNFIILFARYAQHESRCEHNDIFNVFMALLFHFQVTFLYFFTLADLKHERMSSKMFRFTTDKCEWSSKESMYRMVNGPKLFPYIFFK